MNRVLEYIIKAKDSTATAVASAANRIKSFASKVGQNLMNIKAGLDMVLAAGQRFASVFATAIKEAFRFEKAVIDFKVLLGSIDEAKAHVNELRQFANSTPLTFGDVSRASKLLLSFGEAVDEVMPHIKMLGDISMGNQENFQGLSLAFAQCRASGKLMGQDLLQMINRGFNPLVVISKETGKSVMELREMMAKGAISFEMVAEAMRIATSEGGLFHNAMSEASKTGEGLMSTLSDKWTDAVRTFGGAFSDAAKDGIQNLIDKLTELAEDGTVEMWADDIAKAMAKIVDKAKEVVNGCQAIGGALNWLYENLGVSDVVHGVNSIVQGTASGIGAAIGGGSFWDAYDEASYEELSKGYYSRKAMKAGLLGEQGKRTVETDEEYARTEEERRQQVKETAAEKRRQARQKAEEEAAEKSQNTQKVNLKDELNRGNQIADYNKWIASGSTETFDKWLEQEKKALEEYEKKRKEQYAEYLKNTGRGDLVPYDLSQLEGGDEYESFKSSMDKREENEKKIADKRAEEERKLLEQEEAERKRIEEKIHAQRVRLLESELQQRQDEQSNAETMLSNAEQKSAQAWGWYRDKDSLAAQIEEEKANAAAEKQFEKDFSRLKRRRSDWRTADNLSLDDEAVRRVGVAREEEKAAREYAQQTAEATARAAEALDEIRASIEGGDE